MTGRSAEQVPAEVEMSVIQPDRKTVLCISNDPISLNLRCALLKEEGWRVLSAGSGHEGVIRFGQDPLDAVVLDLSDSAESALIASELKRLRPDLPLVMLVAKGNLAIEGATAQADAVIPKADEIFGLLEALRRVRESAKAHS